MSVTEESMAKDLAKRWVGEEEESATASSEAPLTTFEEDFSPEFQTKIAAMALRDPVFQERTEGLVKPEYFDNVAEAALVNIANRYYAQYKRLPDMVILMKLIKEDVAKKTIRSDMLPDIKAALKNFTKASVADRDFVIDQVAEFARSQALTKAIVNAVDQHLERRDFARILEEVRAAIEVGAAEDLGESNYWDRIEQRTHVRKEEAAGTLRKRGITTGVSGLDKRLYHHGWGRKELTLFMGGPKVGKSTALANFAKNASLAGYSVLVCTLEVSKAIYEERLDASIADIAMSELGMKIIEIEDKVKLASKKAGPLILHEFASGTMTPAMLRRVLAKHKAKGMTFDMVAIDYADLMAPNYRTSDEIANSKSIYTDIRAIAQEEDLAMLTATQTNREGAKSVTAKMEHVAEDFNRIRIADLVLSINRTEEEKARDEARLYLAASRNQGGEFSIRVKQDMEKMKFMTKILGIE